MSYIGPRHPLSFRKLHDHPMVEACLHICDWNMGPIGMPWVGDIVECCLAQHLACQKATVHDGLTHVFTNVDTMSGNIVPKNQLSCAKRNNSDRPD